MSIRITATESTDLFVGTEATPRQLLRVTVERLPSAGTVTVDVRGPRVAAAEPVAVPAGEGAAVVEVPLVLDGAAGDVLPCRVEARADAESATAETEVTVEAPGWTMYLVSHFHYDPVWWNTQAAYTSPWEFLSGDATTRPLWEHNGFALVEAHLDLALRDPVYKFVLAEIDYLKPFFDTHPERRADLRRLLAEGRVELLGGTYNEPNTNLTGAETTIRNIVYGVGYQRDILGGDPRTAWQLDVFGHDPQFPGYLDAAGLTGSAWARGPFHQWGPALKNHKDVKGSATVMQFPSEFEWISPSGRGVLTHYMPNHYAAGWWMDSSASLAEAEQATYELYRGLKPVAATPHILLPVGTDYTPPNKWVTQIHRSWAEKYVWPRFVCATPRDFMTAVRASMAERGVAPSPQTRDMNPLYTGKDVSYIDTKQAQRAAEVAALDAERLATVAALLGGGYYPDAALDKVWRQLAYGAHHDAITGSESDQVYIDLVTGWREAYDLASGARDAALDVLVSRVDTSGDGLAVVVANTLSFERSGLVRVSLPDGVTGRLVDDAGAEVPAVVAGGFLTFRAEAVPSFGWRTWRLVPGDRTDPGWSTVDGEPVVENDRFRVVADPARGGALASVYDKVAGRELVSAGRLANELRVYEEYPTHPEFGEGPWHLLPSGPVVDSSGAAAQVRVEHSVLGQRIVARGKVDDVDYEQVVTLLAGGDRVDIRTRVLDYSGADRLIRARFCCDVPGGLPVSEVAAATVGRGFALPDVDTAEAPWTLDNPANSWFGLGSTSRAVLSDVDGTELGVRALGVAEVVVSDVDSAAPLARDLLVAMARVGVTATTSTAAGSRYGWLDVDSNLPDFRIVIGGPDAAGNALAAELVERAGAGYRDELDRQLAATGRGRVWVPAAKPLREVWQPNADLRDVRALPALIVVGRDAAALAAELAELADDFADARITAPHPGPVDPAEPFEDRSVALLTYGLPGFAVDPTGALHVSLLRSCTGWPSGVWIDPPKRTAPDGSSFQLQHWTHEFDYALVAGDGDWRTLELPARGQEYITPLLARAVPGSAGDLPARHSLLRVEPARQVLLGALKPAGNPIAHGSGTAADPADGVTLRLVESTGLGRGATVTTALPWREAYRADLLERRGEPIAVDAAGLGITLAGSEVATVVAVPAAPEPIAEDAPVLGEVTEAAQPVYARYWLHNRGPAPMGYLPVTVAASPALVTADDAAPFTVDVSVASQLTDTEHEGVVGIVVPDGWNAEPTERVYRVDPGGHTSFPVTVTPAAGAAAGMYFVAAQLAVGETMVEDVVSVALGAADAVATLLPSAGDAATGWEASKGTEAPDGRDTGLELSTVDTEVAVRPGELRSIGVRLHNRTRGEIRGELQVASPWGTWDLLPNTVFGKPANPRGFRLAAGVTSLNAFPVRVPRTAEPGHYWALVKVMWFGRVQYSEAIRLVVQP